MLIDKHIIEDVRKEATNTVTEVSRQLYVDFDTSVNLNLLRHCTGVQLPLRVKPPHCIPSIPDC